MELELGLKITHTRDDFTSHAHLQIAKDRTGPLFLSRETDSMFILIAYLKGFRKENIEIKINEDGSKITVSGKRAVQEMVLSGWIMHKNDVESRAFNRVFRIPDGIVLDRIKAKFSDEESRLTIIMPKFEKGMRGLNIEEVKEEMFNGVIGNAAEKPPEEIERSELEIPNEEPKSEREEGGQIKAQAFPERDKSGGMLQEKSEEDKFRKQDLAEPAVLERSVEQKVEEIEAPRESEETPLEKGMEAEDAKQEKEEPTAATKTQGEDLPDFEEQQKIPEPESVEKGKFEAGLTEAATDKLTQQAEEKILPTQSKHEWATEKVGSEMAQEPPEQPESMLPAKQKEEEEEASDEGQHPEEKQVEEKELSEVEEQKDLSEGATKTEKAASKRSKLRPPLVVAGSALLICIIVFVINNIRSRRR